MAATLVQAKQNGSATAAATATVTLGSAPTSGNLLVATVHIGNNATPATTAITGWTSGAGNNGISSGGRGARIYWKVAGAGESATINATITSSPWSMEVHEYSGINTGTLGAVSICTLQTAGTAYATTAMAVTASANIVLVAFANALASGSTTTTTSDFISSTIGGTSATVDTNQSTNNQASPNGYGASFHLEVASAASSYIAATTSPLSRSGAMTLAAFNVAASSGSPNFVPSTTVRRASFRRAHVYGDSFQPPFVAASPPVNPEITQTVFGRLRTVGRIQPRARISDPTPAQQSVVNPAISQTVSGRTRRLWQMIPRRPVGVPPVPAQVVPAPTRVPGLTRARRAAAMLRRARVSTAPRSEELLRAGRSRVRAPGRQRLRAAPWASLPAQDQPPGTTRRLRVQSRSRRPTAAQVARAQVNPPWQPITVRGLRLAARTVRRGELSTPVPAQQPAVPNLARTRRFGQILRRPVIANPTQAQQPAVPNPSITQTAWRTRRFAQLLRRPTVDTPVRGQVNPPIVETAWRVRRFGHVLRRPRIASRTQAQQPAVPNPPITQTAWRTRRFTQILRRPNIDTPVRGQINPPIVQTTWRARRFRHVLRRPAVDVLIPAQQQLVANPRITQTAWRTRRFAQLLRRPAVDTPIRGQINPPYPVKPSRVLALRGLSRRRGGPASVPQVQPVAETRTAAQGGLRGLRRLWLKVRRKHAIPVPTQVTTLQGPLVITDSHGGVEADRNGVEDVAMHYGATGTASGVYGSKDFVTLDPDNDGVATEYDSDSDVL